jgi:hypothetical protein
MSQCPSCHNEFHQPFVCTTCGAEKLRNETMRVMQVTLDRQAALLKQCKAAMEQYPMHLRYGVVTEALAALEEYEREQ